MSTITRPHHILTAEHKYLHQAAVYQRKVSDKSVDSAYPRQRINRQNKNVPKAHFKPIRLAIACLLVLVMADLLPHPALSPGFISTSLSTVKQALQETIR